MCRRNMLQPNFSFVVFVSLDKMKGSCWSEEALVCFEKSQDDGLFDNIKQKYPSLEIDRRALLLMTTPIRFARIKVIDIKAVCQKRVIYFVALSKYVLTPMLMPDR